MFFKRLSNNLRLFVIHYCNDKQVLHFLNKQINKKTKQKTKKIHIDKQTNKNRVKQTNKHRVKQTNKHRVKQTNK